MSKPRHVLLLPFGSIGDAVMLFALCVEIHAHAPNTTFTVLAKRNAKLIADLAAQYSFINVVPVTFTPVGFCKLLWQLLRRPYRALMPNVFSKGSFPAFIFSILRLRPGTGTYGLVNTASLMYDSSMLHIDNLRRLGIIAGFEVGQVGAPITFAFKSHMPASFPFAAKEYIVVHPFGSSSMKSFPPRRTKEVLLQLATKYPQMNFVITGGSENAAAAHGIAESVPRSIVCAGLPILDAVGVIEHAAVFIGVDTGTMHLASVIGQNVVALEHNASPEWLPTYNPNASILTNKEHCTCDGVKNDTCVVVEDGVSYKRCLYEISDESILESVDTHLVRVCKY